MTHVVALLRGGPAASNYSGSGFRVGVPGRGSGLPGGDLGRGPGGRERRVCHLHLGHAHVRMGSNLALNFGPPPHMAGVRTERKTRTWAAPPGAACRCKLPERRSPMRTAAAGLVHRLVHPTSFGWKLAGLGSGGAGNRTRRRMVGSISVAPTPPHPARRPPR